MKEEKRRNRILLVNQKVAKVNLACEPGEDNNKPSIPTTKGSRRDKAPPPTTSAAKKKENEKWAKFWRR